MTYDEIRNLKVGVCVSGGLDSRTIVRKLTELGTDVLCFVADLAQPDEASISDVHRRINPAAPTLSL